MSTMDQTLKIIQLLSASWLSCVLTLPARFARYAGSR